MAVVFVEGFDAYNGTGNTLTAPGTSTRWNPRWNTMPLVAGRFGGQAVQATGASGGRSISTSLPSAYTSGTIGAAVNILGITATYVPSIFSVHSGGGGDSAAQLRLGINGSNAALVILSPTGTIIGATTSNIITLNTWNYIEMSFTISSTVGVVNVYLNGANVLALSGINTKYQTATTFNYIQIGNDINTTGTTYNVDDMYVTDTLAPLGEQRVVTTYVDADASNVSWSPNSGSTLYTQIDETLCNGDTDYIYSGTVNADATFGVQNLPVTPISIQAAQIGAFARKTDTGYRAIALQYETPGGTQYNSSDFVLSGGYGRQLNLLPTNPDTGVAWTEAEINAMKLGTKVTV